MNGSIRIAVPTQAVAQPDLARKPASKPDVQPASKASTFSAPTDTVKISSAATAILQEAMESAVQTAKEAGGGDTQAQRLLAKQAAARK